MDEKALISQLAEMMEMQTQGLIKYIDERVANMLTKDDIEPLTDRAASKAAALVEERLGKRIDVLTDGYKLTHEKQFELERRMDMLERRLQELENRTA